MKSTKVVEKEILKKEDVAQTYDVFEICKFEDDDDAMIDDDVSVIPKMESNLGCKDNNKMKIKGSKKIEDEAASILPTSDDNEHEEKNEKLISLTSKTPSHFSNKPPFFISLSFFFFFSTKPQKPDSSIVANYLINQHGFSPETASKASTVITRLRNPDNSYSVLTFLGKNGFSTTNLEKIVQQVPNVLGFDLDNIIKPKIKLFQDLGFSSDDLAQIISSDPWALTRSADKRLLPSLVMLKSILGTDVSVCKVLKLSGWFLKHDLEKTMIPNIEFMMSCGISKTQITKLVFNFPRFFVLKPESIKVCVKRVDELGFDRSSKMFLHAIRVLSSMSREKWEMKLDLFRSFGFSEKQLLFMFKRAPQVFAVSDKKIRDGTEFLLTTGRCDMSIFTLVPELLVYSLEGRIKPRIRILEILERKNLIRTQPTLTTYLKMADKKFFEKYVSLCEDEADKIFSLATKAHS
ncbi:Mitochodrial transcription termination factor-related [Macleaya cordata]|uniref:Mitochodrial transcription termination factor-related n=1 Tax=Macleaya cordata TaxID=56857 RepID=A0A200QAX9_MACCD|nr:Mitochodrial transcription termination factor-related [Macleaya cordata]